MTRIYRYPKGRDETSYIIPQSVVSIEADAFSGCSKLKNITISNGVKYIKSEAFEYCDFESITIPDNVIEIGDKAFYWCWYVTSIKLPISVSKMGNEAFKYCNNLNSVIYQNKDLLLPSSTFENCDKLHHNIVYEVPKSLFLELAQKGNPEYQYKLAMCYLDGTGFPKDIKASVNWLTTASNNGHILSKVTLGDIYYSGTEVSKNYTEAIKWYLSAAKSGNSRSQRVLGDCYFQGVGVKQNYSTAYAYYKQAADQENYKAQEALGSFYYHGYGGVAIDYKEAIKWYTLSANQGNAEAAYYLAICSNEGKGTDKDDSKALMWIEKAVESGVVKGQGLYCVLTYNDAVNSMNTKSYSSAISKFTSLLKYDNTNIDAYLNRGYCYLNLQNKNYLKAEKDFKKVLELDQTNQAAINNLQIVVEHNNQVEEANNLCQLAYQSFNTKDYANAVAYCAKSISLDNTKPYPYYLIGYCYYNCELYADAINYFNQALTVDPDYTDARKAIKSARTLGILNAISQLATSVSNNLNNAYSNSINYSHSSGYGSSTSSGSTYIKPSVGKQTQVCSFCHGTGKNPAKEHPAQFGLDPVYRETACEICGSHENHYHKPCPGCNGKGYR